jgi:hypothetical protein
VINGGILMQNLINQLMQPELGETKPSTVKRRAAEVLTQALNITQADREGRLKAEADAANNLALLEALRKEHAIYNHEKIYRYVMNKDYQENMQ